MAADRLEIGVRELRESLRTALAQVKDGQELVVTERGHPIARIVPVAGGTAWERLVAEGVIHPAAAPRRRVKAHVRARGPVSELVPEQRR